MASICSQPFTHSYPHASTVKPSFQLSKYPSSSDAFLRYLSGKRSRREKNDNFQTFIRWHTGCNLKQSLTNVLSLANKSAS